MELYQLKYFLYAAKYENISKAAQALRVSQPSISRAVVALEKELQVELFERQGKRIILTRAGLTFREQISPILWKLEGLGRRAGIRYALMPCLRYRSFPVS